MPIFKGTLNARGKKVGILVENEPKWNDTGDKPGSNLPIDAAASTPIVMNRCVHTVQACPTQAARRCDRSSPPGRCVVSMFALLSGGCSIGKISSLPKP